MKLALSLIWLLALSGCGTSAPPIISDLTLDSPVTTTTGAPLSLTGKVRVEGASGDSGLSGTLTITGAAGKAAPVTVALAPGGLPQPSDQVCDILAELGASWPSGTYDVSVTVTDGTDGPTSNALAGSFVIP